MKSRKNKAAVLVLISSLALGLCSCGDDSTPKQKQISDSVIGGLAVIDVDLLGPAFRKAVEEYGKQKGEYRGLAIISSHSNLVLVAVDLGDHSQRALASMYVGESPYWKIEDLNESNRSMLLLLKDRVRDDDRSNPFENEQSQ